MSKKGLFYSETDQCFSSEKKEGYYLLCDLGEELNEMFFYYSEPEILKGFSFDDMQECLYGFLLQEIGEDELDKFIRYRLDRKNLGRFEMSGYDVEVGDSYIHNQRILNEFSDLGIFNFTSFLSIDFYKGSGYIYYKDFYEDSMNVKDQLTGMKTVDIIKEIFLLTIFSDKRKRRR